jgi:HEAT repeat protein
MPPQRKFSLVQLRNRARELLRAFRSNDASARARVAAALPRFKGGNSAQFKLAHALAVIARENRHPSWESLVAFANAEEQRRVRRHKRDAKIQSLAEEIVARAKAHDVTGLAAIPGIGKEDAAKVIAIIAAEPKSWRAAIDAYILGLSHENPRVRYECAHMLDRFGDPRAVEPLVNLSYDSVPRVRWMAMHALSCDICKAERPQSDKALGRAIELAIGDESVQVRRHATCAVAALGGRGAEEILRTLQADPDAVVRRNAKQMLRLLNRPQSTATG